MQYLQLILDNWKTVVAIQQGLFCALALLFSLLKMVRVSKVFGTFAAVDFGRIQRWIAIVLQIWAAKRAVKKELMKPTIIGVFVALLLSGCTMSLEQARADGIRHRSTQAQTTPVTGPGRSECIFLDDTQRIFSYGGITFAAVGAGAGSIALATSGDTQKSAEWAAAIAGGATITFVLLQRDFEAKWAELCAG